MDYNTEAINEVAEEVAKILKNALEAQPKKGKGDVKIAQVESNMREVMLKIGNEALSILLSSEQTTPLAEIGCECGGILHYQRMREATVISVFGKTKYKRAYYAGCSCKKGKAPIDEQFGLEPGAVTAGLAKLLALAGIEFSYDESQDGYSLFCCSIFPKTQYV